MSEEWGLWIEHDGRGCPVPRGTVGAALLQKGVVVAFCAGFGSTTGGPYSPPEISSGNAWDWSSVPDEYRGERVIRYRIRKPRGVTILQRLLADLPEQVDA